MGTLFSYHSNQVIELPLFLERVACGFPSPAQDGRLSHFQQARLVEFENAGHWLHHDQFGRFMGELRAFL